jgi:hypothetical protein
MTPPDTSSSDEAPLVFLCTVSLETSPPQVIFQNPHGDRQIVPVTGGSFDGPHLRGMVLQGGDSTLQRPDGVRELDARMTWQTDDGALLYVTYRGYRAKVPEVPPAWMAGAQRTSRDHYHMVSLRFETGAARYAWLEQAVVVGRGSLVQGNVSYEVFAVR